MLVSVGSGSNADDPDTHPKEFHRADVLEYTPKASSSRSTPTASATASAKPFNPITGQLWCSTNERDDLGNHLVPDYVTSIKEGGFYGWPWYYMGGHQDPRLPRPCANGTGPTPGSRAHSGSGQGLQACRPCRQGYHPDVLVQPHMASLEMTFYPHAGEFPTQYDGDAFAAEHGSWNRANRAGYEVIRIPMHDGHADGSYEDFLTGFVTKDGQVWGRPVGVAIAKDGSIFVTDDGSRSVWHVSYIGK